MSQFFSGAGPHSIDL